MATVDGPSVGFHRLDHVAQRRTRCQVKEGDVEYQLVWLDPEGEAHVLVLAIIHPILFSQLVLRVSDLSQLIPGLMVVTQGHLVTGLIFTEGQVCNLQGTEVQYAN